MSLIENLRKATQPLQTPDIERRLNAAESALAELESQHGEAALEALSDEPGAGERLENLNINVALARGRVANLKAAHKAATERDEATIRAQRVALQATQLRAVRKHLEIRDAATIAMCDALKIAVEKYQLAANHGRKATEACPGGVGRFPASLCPPHIFETHVQGELFRLSNDGDVIRGHNSAFPGSQCSAHPGFSGKPEAIPALAELVKEDSARVMATLTGKVA